MSSLFGFNGSLAGQLAYDMCVLEDIRSQEEAEELSRKEHAERARKRRTASLYTQTELGYDDGDTVF